MTNTNETYHTLEKRNERAAEEAEKPLQLEGGNKKMTNETREQKLNEKIATYTAEVESQPPTRAELNLAASKRILENMLKLRQMSDEEVRAHNRKDMFGGREVTPWPEEVFHLLNPQFYEMVKDRKMDRETFAYIQMADYISLTHGRTTPNEWLDERAARIKEIIEEDRQTPYAN